MPTEAYARLSRVHLMLLRKAISVTFDQGGLSIQKNELAENSKLKIHKFSADGENVLQHNIDFQR